MKILHLVDETWDSGLTAYALQILHLLHKNKEHVRLGVLAGKAAHMKADQMGLKTLPFANNRELLGVIKSERWDIINAHTGRMHTWAVLFQMAGLYPKTPVIRTRGDARPLNVHFAGRSLYRFTAAVICASDHMAKQYRASLRAFQLPIETIYPSIEADSSIQPAPANRVGILGRLDPVKGHSVFLDAAAQVLKKKRDVRFRIAGAEAGIPMSLLKNQAEQLGIHKAVEFLSFQPSAQEFMRDCSVGVIASTGSEEISRVCLEWMAVGRPVVGTLVGCLPELIEPYETGFLVPPADSSALAGALLHLLDDQRTAASYGHKGHAYVKKNLSPDQQLSKTLRLYQSVQGTSGQGR